MDVNNPVIKLCAAGAQAEFAGQTNEAKALYHQAWNAATDDYEACIAAHYMARHQPPEEAFRWNQIALDRADAVADARVQPFYGSLYVNMGHSYETLGDQAAAEQYYALAATFGVVHQRGVVHQKVEPEGEPYFDCNRYTPRPDFLRLLHPHGEWQ